VPGGIRWNSLFPQEIGHPIGTWGVWPQCPGNGFLLDFVRSFRDFTGLVLLRASPFGEIGKA